MIVSPLTEQDRRAGFTAGLRQLANILDTNPDLPLPYHGTTSGLLWILQPEQEQRQLLARFARLFDGPATKGYRDTDFDLKGNLAGLQVHLIADRAEVCERVVTGTREVTKEVLDPEALAAVPTVTVTETVEDVEWVCAPLLADSQASA